MNSSACYRNGTQNGDGIGQCEHTITARFTRNLYTYTLPNLRCRMAVLYPFTFMGFCECSSKASSFTPRPCSRMSFNAFLCGVYVLRCALSCRIVQHRNPLSTHVGYSILFYVMSKDVRHRSRATLGIVTTLPQTPVWLSVLQNRCLFQQEMCELMKQLSKLFLNG